MTKNQPAQGPVLPPALFEKRLIPALRSPQDLAAALESQLPAVMLLKGDIFDVAQIMDQAQRHDVQVFIHIDLIDGIGRDRPGLRYLQQQLGVSGVVSTRSNLLKEAHNLGMLTILRLFVLDSAAYNTGINLLSSVKPDAVEILPGVVLPHIAEETARDIQQPIIAGGIIKTEEDIRTVLAAGATAVSTSRQELWKFRPDK
jgi:glycerol uptake operon antiterminator